MTSNRLLQECLEDFTDILRLPMALYDQTETVWQERSRAAGRADIENFSDSAAVCRHWKPLPFQSRR